MAESMFMYAVAAGVFVFLVGLLSATRGARGRRGHEAMPETHSGGSGEGKRIKKFKSDGTPVYD
ncbi:MAG: hypothetical protein ACREAY_07945 [Nitrososphaera sp.]|uniref:hypothetical protein n=1 Tax=Nitrososphaera sp. TaxID=1971748 RepID=UPI003D700C6B